MGPAPTSRACRLSGEMPIGSGGWAVKRGRAKGPCPSHRIDKCHATIGPCLCLARHSYLSGSGQSNCRFNLPVSLPRLAAIASLQGIPRYFSILGSSRPPSTAKVVALGAVGYPPVSVRPSVRLYHSAPRGHRHVSDLIAPGTTPYTPALMSILSRDCRVLARGEEQWGSSQRLYCVLITATRHDGSLERPVTIAIESAGARQVANIRVSEEQNLRWRRGTAGCTTPRTDMFHTDHQAWLGHVPERIAQQSTQHVPAPLRDQTRHHRTLHSLRNAKSAVSRVRWVWTDRAPGCCAAGNAKSPSRVCRASI